MPLDEELDASKDQDGRGKNPDADQGKHGAKTDESGSGEDGNGGKSNAPRSKNP